MLYRIGGKQRISYKLLEFVRFSRKYYGRQTDEAQDY